MKNQQPLLPNVPSQSTCFETLFDNQTPTISVDQSSREEVFIENIQIKTEDERTKESEKMVPRILSPESALMVFSKLFPDVQIKLQKHPENALNCLSYSATLEIDGQMFTAIDISTSGASEKACEKFLRNMLAKKISKISEENEKSSMEIKMADEENDTIDAFPWEQFIQLAMHKLIIQ